MTREREVEQHYTPAQAAQLLAVSERTILRMISAGRICRVRHVGRLRRIPASALAAYLERNTLRAPAA